MLFVVDPSEDSVLENALTLAVIENAHIGITTMNKSTVGWSVYESI